MRPVLLVFKIAILRASKLNEMKTKNAETASETAIRVFERYFVNCIFISLFINYLFFLLKGDLKMTKMAIATASKLAIPMTSVGVFWSAAGRFLIVPFLIAVSGWLAASVTYFAGMVIANIRANGPFVTSCL